MSTHPLPTPRNLLTSLFNTLTTTTHPPPHEPEPKVNEPYDPPSNPLKNLSPSHKALLSTLHVLFTPPMLLQALDLLDRGLVVRVVEMCEDVDGGGIEGNGEGSGARVGGDVRVGDAGTENRDENEAFPPQANIHLHSSPPAPQTSPTTPAHQNQACSAPKNTIHQVRSSQPPKSRFRDATSTSSSTSNSSSGSGSNIYTVRLHAWNCTCAAFAFASFPASSVYPSKSPWDLDLIGNEIGDEGGEDMVIGGIENGDGDEGEKWEFGGLSMDGKRGGGDVPCCKHLLACVLGERWDVLGGYVKERVVSREEMAGLGCK